MSQLFVIELKGPSGVPQYFHSPAGRWGNNWVRVKAEARQYEREATAVAKRARLYNGIPRSYSLEVVPADV